MTRKQFIAAVEACAKQHNRMLACCWEDVLKLPSSTPWHREIARAEIARLAAVVDRQMSAIMDMFKKHG